MNLLNQRVVHSSLGTGTVIAQNETSITVAFSSKISKFIYPRSNTFEKFLKAEDAAVQEAILQEIDEEKRKIEEAKVAEEEAKRKAREAAMAAEKARREKEALSKPRGDRREPVQKDEARIERIPGKPQCFFVFQGGTFDSESHGGFIWAPQHGSSGNRVFHWDNMLKVQKGDIVFHGFNASVAAVSQAISDCYEYDRPDDRIFEDLWNTDGRRVDLRYQLLENPIKTADHVDEILKYCQAKYSPFDRDGNGNMGYLYELRRELAHVFMKAAVRRNPGLEDVDFVKAFLAEEDEE